MTLSDNRVAGDSLDHQLHQRQLCQQESVGTNKTVSVSGISVSGH